MKCGALLIYLFICYQFMTSKCFLFSLILYPPEQKRKEEGAGGWYFEKGSRGYTGADWEIGEDE